MTAPRMKFAKLDEASLGKLRALEQEYGAPVLAVETQHPFAELTADQVKRVQTLERELGAVLLAYQRS